VAWEIGRAEDEESWEALLSQMWERGVVPERGLRLLVGDGAPALTPARQMVYWAVPFQRCVFHKLRNMRRDILMPEGLEGQEARAYRRRFIRSAARIWQAPTEQEARKRQQRFCQRWQTQQPLAIATVCRDFEQTLAFYRAQASAALRGEQWPAYRLRTASPLERELRAFRKRLSGAVILHSTTGLMAIVHQLLVRRAAERAGAPPGTWQTTLERALAEVQPIS
jgi:transposase-like protein